MSNGMVVQLQDTFTFEAKFSSSLKNLLSMYEGMCLPQGDVEGCVEELVGYFKDAFPHSEMLVGGGYIKYGHAWVHSDPLSEYSFATFTKHHLPDSPHEFDGFERWFSIPDIGHLTFGFYRDHRVVHEPETTMPG